MRRSDGLGNGWNTHPTYCFTRAVARLSCDSHPVAHFSGVGGAAFSFSFFNPPSPRLVRTNKKQMRRAEKNPSRAGRGKKCDAVSAPGRFGSFYMSAFLFLFVFLTARAPARTRARLHLFDPTGRYGAGSHNRFFKRLSFRFVSLLPLHSLPPTKKPSDGDFSFSFLFSRGELTYNHHTALFSPALHFYKRQ